MKEANQCYIVLKNLQNPYLIELAKDSEGLLWMFGNLEDAKTFIEKLEREEITMARAVAI